MSSVHSRLKPWWKVIDWRLVAAVLLPLWAFLFGVMVPRKAATAVVLSPPEAPPVVTSSFGETIPMPREIVLRAAEPVVVPVVVPVPVPAEQAAAKPAEFQLPASELFASPDKCKTFGTKVRFHSGPADAIAEAKSSKKLLFVLHISGHFDDPGFT